MQICPVCNSSMTVLFTSWYCTNCENKGNNKEVRFEDLSPNQKRVAIAKDVVERVHNNNFTPIRGKFVNYRTTWTKNTDTENSKVDEWKLAKCEACALGAIILSCAERLGLSEDKSTFIRDLSSDHDSRLAIHRRLKPYFSTDQLDLIESAFERNYNHAIDLTNPLLRKAADFTDGLTPENAMIKIMTNIIENDGTFTV